MVLLLERHDDHHASFPKPRLRGSLDSKAAFVVQHFWPNAALCNFVGRFHPSMGQPEDLSADAYDLGYLIPLSGLQPRRTSVEDMEAGLDCNWGLIIKHLRPWCVGVHGSRCHMTLAVHRQ